jgi:hypothetical protein
VPNKIEVPLVGVRFRVTPTTIEEIAGQTPISAKLKREPENIHDSYAIAVYLTERPWKDFQVGYVSRDVARLIAPKMDAGKFNVVEAWVTEIDPNQGAGSVLVKWTKSKLRSENGLNKGEIDT